MTCKSEDMSRNPSAESRDNAQRKFGSLPKNTTDNQQSKLHQSLGAHQSKQEISSGLNAK